MSQLIYKLITILSIPLGPKLVRMALATAAIEQTRFLTPL